MRERERAHEARGPRAGDHHGKLGAIARILEDENRRIRRRRVGGHIAAKLAARGHDVSVVGRGAHFEAMREKGVTLIHGADTIRGRVRTTGPRRAGCRLRHA